MGQSKRSCPRADPGTAAVASSRVDRRRRGCNGFCFQCFLNRKIPAVNLAEPVRDRYVACARDPGRRLKIGLLPLSGGERGEIPETPGRTIPSENRGTW